MSFRQLLIKKAEKIRIKNSNILIIKETKEELIIPLDEISIVLIEDPNLIMTTRFITTCSKNNIGIYLCDEFHTPVSLITSFNNHYNQLEIFYLQLELKQKVKDELWNQIIKAKILNQSKVLKIATNQTKYVEMLENYATEVVDADIKNRESSAAKVYFYSLFGTEFIRFYDDAVNAGLNYGYKILVSVIIKELTKYGLDSKLGIWHSSKSNCFNLAYDLIEPFRPLIDYYIFLNFDCLSLPLSFTMRKKIINIVNKKILIKNKVYTVSYAIAEMMKSYVNILKGKQTVLLTPEIVEIDLIDEQI